MLYWQKVDQWLMALTTHEASYIIVLGIVISVLPISSTIFTHDCSLFSHTTTLSDILHQATYWTWQKHIDPFWPTFSCFTYWFLFPMHWPSSTDFQTLCLTSVLAESIWEHLVRNSHRATLGLLDPRCHRLALHQIHHVPPSHLHIHLDYRRNHPS